jgi:hypothetical protein
VTFYSAALGGTVAMILQVTGWLRDGRWTALPLVETLSWGALQFFPPPASFMSWINHPAAWFGLHKLAVMTPTVVAFAALALAGLVIAGLGRATRREAGAFVIWGSARPRVIWQY